ncbi:MoxR family ATPase [Egibacter rhizosphaerae]|uniref:MoxR family ATPase n=1 Tax=Egibacter rhizosphaerae TaxID=1670831 RepID=A0A411YJR5_9ACTN|nr:MoxR family ATPase [Egibacter rhizosphaerae]QBI21439.1 MoxR family ATPase [Egibacter rhizosphaerae]
MEDDALPPLIEPEVGPEGVRDALAREGYLADDGLATACFLAIQLHRPLFLEGAPGVGKTEISKALAAWLGAPLIRLQCYEGIDAAQALYDWDFPRQLLHLRSVEAWSSVSGTSPEPEDLERRLYDRRFLVARPLLQALEISPSVLLIDELDRADDDFEAFLLEVLSDFSVTVPEVGTIRAAQPPLVVITSNRTREVHDALKRRCYYYWLTYPTFEREVEILRTRLPRASRRLAEQVTAAVQQLRRSDLTKPPGVAETLDWAQAVLTLGCEELDPDVAARTLGSVLKYQEDQERVAGIDYEQLIGVPVEPG